MRLKLRPLSRFRPRILTLIVFFAAAAVIALANLSYDEAVAANGITHRCYGWPLIWHRIVLFGWLFTGRTQAVGWYWSLPRLAANVAMWLMLLAAASTLCEWLLRRYRPRLRWSLRALLAFVAVAALMCGWYAHARNRAAIQDPLVGLRVGYGMPLVFVDRCGPKWLDILGMDHLRRRVVSAKIGRYSSTSRATSNCSCNFPARLTCGASLISMSMNSLPPQPWRWGACGNSKPWISPWSG